MQRYGNIQSPYDPYTGVQLSYTRYTGLRRRDFWDNAITRDMSKKEIHRGIAFGAIAFVGFVVLNLLTLG